jgi:hypothetical protein
MKFSDIFYAGYCSGFLVAFGAASMMYTGVPAWIILALATTGPLASAFFFHWLFTLDKPESP